MSSARRAISSAVSFVFAGMDRERSATITTSRPDLAVSR
jgi:hypothetical protein